MVTRYLSDPEAQDIEKIFCKDLLLDIHYYDGYRNCAVMAQWVLFVAHKYGLKLLEIENLLRLNNCHSYLVGLPSSELAEHQTSRDVFNKEFKETVRNISGVINIVLFKFNGRLKQKPKIAE